MSIVLNGSNQALHRNAVIGTRPFTVAAWAKPSNTTAKGAIYGMGKTTSGAVARYLAMRGTTGGDPVSVTDDELDFVDTTSGYSSGAWQHVAATFVSATNRNVFLGGTNKGTGTTNTGPSGTTTTLGVYYIYLGGSGWFPGNLAEIAVWDIELSDAEIASLATGVYPNQIQAVHCIAYWPLLSDANDDVGSYHMTEDGSPSYDGVDHPTMKDLISYTELAATGGGTSGGSAVMAVAETLELAATGGGTSGGSAALTMYGYGSGNAAGHGRLVAVGNDELWYEDI